MNLKDIRKDYRHEAIHDSDFPVDPFTWFSKWLEDALKSQEPEPTALVLSTVSPEGRPSSRVVLLKSFDENGFVFFTNYKSRKGRQLETNSFASIVFFWPHTERQVRIEGIAEKVEDSESDVYFDSRPEESKMNAIISPQSQVIESRAFLESEREKLFAENDKGLFKRPQHWGGYRVKPDRMEFWQGRPGRLHDRIQYFMEGNIWTISRLAP